MTSKTPPIAERRHREIVDAIKAARADDETRFTALTGTLARVQATATAIQIALEARPANPASQPDPAAPIPSKPPAAPDPVPPLPGVPGPAPTAPLSGVAVTIGDLRYSDWRDAGGGRMVQRWGDFTLWHDAFGVIVEYPARSKAMPPLLGPTRITIERDGATVYTHLPQFIEPGTRWRWRWNFPADMPDHRALTARMHRERLLPRIDLAVMGTDALPTPNAVYQHGQTSGQQNDMGIVQPEAWTWLASGSRAHWDAMVADGETIGLVPIHLRAPNGVDACDPDNPYVCLHPSGKEWYLPLMPGPKSKWDFEIAHQQSWSFVLWLATGDWWHLENLQALSRFNAVYKPAARPQPWTARRVHLDEIREAAWGLRTMIQVYLATPDEVPSWLLPKAYWKARLDEWLETIARAWLDLNPDHFNPYGIGANGDHLAFIRDVGARFPVGTLVGAVKNWTETFDRASAGMGASLWQEDDVTQMLGYAIWAGIKNPHLDRLWAARAPFVVARHLDPIWRINPSPSHYAVLAENGHIAVDVAEAGRMTLARMKRDRASARASGQASLWDGWNLDEAGKFGGPDPFYLPASQAALAMACLNGVAGAREAWAWVAGELRRFKQPFVPQAIDPTG